MSWGKDESDDSTITDEDVERMLDEEPPFTSPICCAVYGRDGTAKSGVVLDQLDEEEIEQGKQILVIDWDGTAAPIKHKYHGGIDNINIVNPITFDETTERKRDYSKEVEKTFAVLKYAVENQKDLNLKVLAIDGLSRLLKALEYRMKANANISEEDRVNNRFEWGKRNQPFVQILLMASRFDGRVFFTTHTKENKEMVNVGGQQQLKTTGREPIWTKQAPQLFFQKVAMSRVEGDDGEVTISGKVEKSKTDSTLEGETYDVMYKSPDGEVTWNGLNDFFDELES